MANKKTQTKPTVSENILELERLMKKVLRNSFKDNTLDYTIQIAVTSVEPETVKYGFMISGFKKELQPMAMSYYTFNDCKAVLEGFLTEIDPAKVEEMFHVGRINTYKNAITSHEERMEEIKKNGVDDDDGIVMEEV